MNDTHPIPNTKPNVCAPVNKYPVADPCATGYVSSAEYAINSEGIGIIKNPAHAPIIVKAYIF